MVIETKLVEACRGGRGSPRIANGGVDVEIALRHIRPQIAVIDRGHRTGEIGDVVGQGGAVASCIEEELVVGLDLDVDRIRLRPADSQRGHREPVRTRGVEPAGRGAGRHLVHLALPDLARLVDAVEIVELSEKRIRPFLLHGRRFERTGLLSRPAARGHAELLVLDHDQTLDVFSRWVAREVGKRIGLAVDQASEKAHRRRVELLEHRAIVAMNDDLGVGAPDLKFLQLDEGSPIGKEGKVLQRDPSGQHGAAQRRQGAVRQLGDGGCVHGAANERGPSQRVESRERHWFLSLGVRLDGWVSSV